MPTGLGLRPGAKAPDEPPTPYRLRASPRLYTLFDVFLFFRDRSNRANSARVGVSTPDASANRRMNASWDSPVSRRSMLRIAAFASSVVASMPTVFPRTRPAADSRSRTHVNTASWVSTSIRHACATASSDPAPPPSIPGPGTTADSANRPPATQSPAPKTGPRSSRSTASGNTAQDADSAGPSAPRRRPSTTLPRTRRTRSPPRPDSGARSDQLQDGGLGHARHAGRGADAVALEPGPRRPRNACRLTVWQRDLNHYPISAGLDNGGAPRYASKWR